MVHTTDDWSLFGGCFVFGLKSSLTWNSLDFLKIGFDYAFRVVSLYEEFNHFNHGNAL